MAESPEFHFFADFADKQVLDKDGRPVGAVHDLAFTLADAYPKATRLVLRRGRLAREYAEVPWEGIEAILLTIRLSLPGDELAWRPEPPAHDLTIARDILDKQVVDTSGQKVIRVNDVYLLQVGAEIRLSHVDVGIRGIVRRLGWQWWVDPFVQTFLARTEYMKEHLINWRYVQPLAVHPQKGTLKLTVPQKQLSLIPHADFSEMLLHVDVYKRAALFDSIAADFRPKVFADLSLDVQKELLENMDLKEAADLLSKVPADQTTDILDDIPKSMADSVLALMETTQARRLSALLGYTSDSAGGLMTTEIITVPHHAGVAEAIERVRRHHDALENYHHVYLVDDNNKLLGLVPLKKLLLALPTDPIVQHSMPKSICVRVKDSLREVAFVMEKYKVPAIPVVNNGKERILLGVITIDDILARVVPLAWRRRVKGAPPA